MPACFAQTVAGPEMPPVISGTAFRALQAEGLLPQLLFAVTQIFPVENEVPKLTVTEVVPCPETIVAPVGTVQVYDVAPVMDAMEYTTPFLLHKPTVSPVITVGVEREAWTAFLLGFKELL
jgi:hypothetical protein